MQLERLHDKPSSPAWESVCLGILSSVRSVSCGGDGKAGWTEMANFLPDKLLKSDSDEFLVFE